MVQAGMWVTVRTVMWTAVRNAVRAEVQVVVLAHSRAGLRTGCEDRGIVRC